MTKHKNKSGFLNQLTLTFEPLTKRNGINLLNYSVTEELVEIAGVCIIDLIGQPSGKEKLMKGIKEQ